MAFAIKEVRKENPYLKNWVQAKNQHDVLSRNFR